MTEFFDLLILMVVIWTAGRVFNIIRLPIVFGELLGGILIGPAVFGLVHADSEVIKVIAELGIFFLMLHSGLETKPEELFQCSKKAILVALGGTILPFAGGFLTAQAFGYDFNTSLFVGMGLCITAIALAARLFKDMGIHRSEVAHLTLGAAVVDDILALILLSVVINLAETGTVEFFPLLFLIFKVTAFFAIVIFGGMKTSKFLNRIIYFGNKGFTLTLIIALFMGLVAEWIGLHMIIGAFLAGLFVREEVIDQRVFNKIEDRVYGLAFGFFGPVFFASLAFHLDLCAFRDAPLFLGIITLVAIIGKIVGSGGIARLLKLSSKQSLAIGLAMNNRGAVELIIASIGLKMGIIDQTVFSVLVIMAFVTTVFSILAMTPVANYLRIHHR